MMRRSCSPLVVFATIVMLFGLALSSPAVRAGPQPLSNAEKPTGKTIHRFAPWKDDEASDPWFWVAVIGGVIVLGAVGGGAVMLVSRKLKPGRDRRSGRDRRRPNERRRGD